MPHSSLPKLFFISILSFITIPTVLTHSHSQCLDDQKSLLLQLKNELIFNSSLSRKLVQWNQMDECCKWYGVECDGEGNVITLKLDGEAISGGIGDSSSLYRLEYLEKLNLAYNLFNSTQIPRGIINLTYLTHLNLSNAHFGGQVPLEISFLRRLVSLDISNHVTWDIEVVRHLNYFPPWNTKPLKVEYPNLEMILQNLTGLRELYLDRVNITSYDERRKWSHIISSYLPNLTSLSLRHCDLYGPLSKSFWQLHSLSILRLDSNNLSRADPDLFANFSRLTHLSLVNCGLKGSFPNMIFKIPTLRNVDLSWNKLITGSIAPFTQNGSLESIVLRNTNLSGLILTSLSNLKFLSTIDLSHSQFTGTIPSSFANLTELVYVDLSYNFFTGSLSSTLFESLSNLVYLNLGYNSFIGHIPQSVFGLPSLEKLWLNNNQFIGRVEGFSIVNVSNIVTLDLSTNRLGGPIPDSFFQLQSLEYLVLFGNLFNGTFQLDKIQSFANLTTLDLSDNNLSVNVANDNSSRYTLPQLKKLSLVSCNLYDFPVFIKHSDMRVLDLSNNRIAGQIPSWIWGIKFQELNLSLNHFTDLQMSYHIPASLQFLDLSSNQLQSELQPLIPPNIGNHTYSLRYLLLSNNSFSGTIPTSLCSVPYLDVLDLSINKLSGSIPPCLLEATNILSVLDLGRNNISGRILGNFPLDCLLLYLAINNNTLEGKIPNSILNCKFLEYMNVGNNIITGSFPCMMSSRLRVLVLHYNKFHGEVRCPMSWPNLQILDISTNNFSGSLEYINFSSWSGMMLGSDAQLRYNRSRDNFLGFNIYPVEVVLIMKGSQVELVKIWPDITVVDFSSNNFGGEIPNEIGDLSSLILLNLSHNALNRSIPKSLGKLGKLESLDLSKNQLTAVIPMELARLTFLSVLNLSYNKLVGMIPIGPQFQTFSEDTFKGNPELCGLNLNISCSDTDGNDLSPPEHENVEQKKEIEWEYVSAALGYVVGLGIFIWILVFSRTFRGKYFGKVDEVIEEIFDGRDRRRRRARRVLRNRIRRQ